MDILVILLDGSLGHQPDLYFQVVSRNPDCLLVPFEGLKRPLAIHEWIIASDTEYFLFRQDRMDCVSAPCLCASSVSGDRRAYPSGTDLG